MPEQKLWGTIPKMKGTIDFFFKRLPLKGMVGTPTVGAKDGNGGAGNDGGWDQFCGGGWYGDSWYG